MSRVKLSLSFNLQVVKHFLSTGDGKRKTGALFSVDQSNVRHWVNLYKQHGISGLYAVRHKYTAEEKERIIIYMQNKLSARQAAVEFNIKTPHSIILWERRYDEGGLTALSRKPREQSTVPKKPDIPAPPPENDRPSQQERTGGTGVPSCRECIFKKAGSLNSTTEVVCAKVKAQIVDELRQKYSMVCLLAAAGLARSTFYYQKSISDRPDRYQREKQLILDIFRRHRGRYGYRRIAAACRNAGISISPNTVQRLMRELGIASYIRRKKYQSYKGTIGKVAPNILQRKFVATQPNQKWVTDVTEFKVEDKKLYLSPVLDLFNGEVIAHQLAERPDFNLASSMLAKAIATLKEGDAPLTHSDQGWQYQSIHFQRELGRHNIAQSMSRKGNCYDNAVMESFFRHAEG